MSIASQVHTLIDLKVPELCNLSPSAFAFWAQDMPDLADALVVVNPSIAPPSTLAPLLARNGKPGFVVSDMTDVDEFSNIDGLQIPESPLYLLRNVERGDQLRNWSPDEAYPEIHSRARTPLTLNEGICWLLAEPERLEPNHCFMTIGTRKRKASKGALDARTPAIWISGGTGRDGRQNRDAPKVGWCWAGNRHTWLGFASAEAREPLS